MNIIKLPDDILNIIIDEMNENILHISITNKEFYGLSKDRLKQKQEKIERKIEFFNKFIKKHNDNTIRPYNFYWGAFNGVITLEECDFVCEKYYNDYGSHDIFLSRVRYTIKNTYQISAEIWTKYLNIHDQKPQL